ncbi:integral membrane protein [Colletotrichum incanum]|uniref:Integral membrane protein n=1 Tax=Colletotrichum incanum TaxID=1573173 RepID=A0A161WBR3_COLIC|nr:integral membrane protein [Colletotrichum incanum]
MRIPPVEVILSWPPPRYDNPETRGPANEIVAIILLVIATIILAIRIHTRRCITNAFGWDDILIVLAFIPATGFVVLGVIATNNYGWGRHIWDLPTDMLAGSLQIGLASQILFDLATSFTKLSTLALMYRIACAASNKLRVLVMALQIFISVNCIVFMLVAMLQCRPLKLYWTLSIGPQNCINEAAHLLVASIINTVTDFAVVLLPLALVRVVYADKLTSRQMTIVNLLFGAGFLASFAGAARTYFTWIMTTEPDASWNAWINWLMSCVELFLGITCTSIPSTKPFFNKYIPKLLGTSSRKSQATSAPVPTDKTTKASVITSRFSNGSDTEAVDAAGRGLPAESKSPAARRFSDATLNKPLPAVMKNHSVYTINIQLDEASLGPADRTRAPSGPVKEQTDLAWRQAVSNFSRPKIYHVRSNSEPSSQHRLSIYNSPREVRRDSHRRSSGSSSSTTTSGESSRHSHILDDVESIYRQSIDDLEVGVRYSPYDHHNSSAVPAPLRKHAKSVSIGTFGG